MVVILPQFLRLRPDVVLEDQEDFFAEVLIGGIRADCQTEKFPLNQPFSDSQSLVRPSIVDDKEET